VTSAHNDVEQVIQRLRTAKRMTVLTGAGVSAASGVPTFRGPDGLWRNFRPDELATASAFARNPELVWEWYAWRRGLIATCRPNTAHDVIARWSRTFPHCCVLTQNVDDLHLRAGTSNLTRLHGSIWELSCWDDCGAPSWRDETLSPTTTVPRCPTCGGLARPAVVWFGEALRASDLDAAFEACACDVFLTVGTSSIVHPAAGLVHEAHRRGAFTVEINLDSTPASSLVDVSLQGPAERILAELDANLFS
jgi:NAD-dependent deacetylase